MKVLLIIAFVYYGNAIHTQNIEMLDMIKCEKAAAKVKIDMTKHEYPGSSVEVRTSCIDGGK